MICCTQLWSCTDFCRTPNSDSKQSEFDLRLHRYNTSLLLGSEAGSEIPVMHIHLQAVLVVGDPYTGG